MKILQAFLLSLSLISVATASAKDGFGNELALIEGWLDGQRAYDRVPGLSVAVVKDQALLWSTGFGHADLERNRAATSETIYGICSISKLFTGIAVMQLRDQGKFGLDDSVERLLPWYNLEQSFKDSPPVTLRALLTHSSGLPRESDTPYWMPPDFAFPSREAVREILGRQATLYPADRYYQYSNLGLTLAGEIVAGQSGESFDTYVRRNILEPLSLDDTETGFPEDERAERIATGYSFPGRSHQLEVLPRYDARAITPAAGFASTVIDLGKFAAWQFRVLGGKQGEVLAPNTLREMQRVQWMDWDWSVARGLAFGVYRVGNRTLSGHAGSCPGFETRLFLDPVSRLAVTVMANRNRVDVDGYAAGVLDLLEANLTNEDTPRPENPDDYLGSYNLSPWDGELLVFKTGSGLGFINLPTMDPAGSITRLRHADGDRFHVVRSDDENGAEVRFRRNEEGRVTHLVMHSLDLPRMPSARD